MASHVATSALVDQPGRDVRHGAWIAAGVTLAACLSGLMAGFFFAFTNVVAPALGAVDPRLAGDALAAVYAEVRDWPFEILFFAAIGAALAALAAAIGVRRGLAWRVCVVGASLLVLVGIFGVTGWRIAPAGRLLAETGGAPPPSWAGFLADWRFWNDLRTFAGAAAMTLYLAALSLMPALWRRRGDGDAPPRESLRVRMRKALAASPLGRLSPAPLVRRLHALRPVLAMEAFWRRAWTPVGRLAGRWLAPLGRALADRPVLVLAVAVALFAFMTGFFWAFDVVVVPALRALDPTAGLMALDAINVEVRNIVFALLFFGGLAITRNVAGFALFATPGLVGRLTLASAALYAVGVFVLTFMVMVPINGAIAVSLAAGRDPGAEWAVATLADWAHWNGLRTMAGFASVATLATALFLLTGRPRRARPAAA